jgi:hypothetical protein
VACPPRDFKDKEKGVRKILPHPLALLFITPQP